MVNPCDHAELLTLFSFKQTLLSVLLWCLSVSVAGSNSLCYRLGPGGVEWLSNRNLVYQNIVFNGRRFDCFQSTSIFSPFLASKLPSSPYPQRCSSHNCDGWVKTSESPYRSQMSSFRLRSRT